ncbi:MAG: sigma 54-interacting transcriptional regulator [Anaerotruncus sp.]|nr:sigma 54-interacting transcriptional regulator [Anaerotruncus sp.]
MAKRETAYLFYSGRRSKLPAFSQEFLETVFESSYDGIYITDGNALTIMVNRSYESISGLRRADMLGQNMHDLVKKRVISQSGTLAALEKREPVTLEQVFKTGKHAIITSTPIFNESNQIVMVVTNVRDVTELYSLQEELEKSKERNLQYHSELENLRRQVGGSAKVIAQDPAMQEVLRVANKVAGLDAPILLEGETGSGKRDLARYIVTKSRRKKEKFIEVNCSCYSAEMLERELFGCAPGKLSAEGTPGLLELADGGTVFLDEVSELPLEVQSRLIQLMQTHLMERIGAMSPIRVDVRILASTSRDLKELVQARLFREDLYYRLNVLPIQMLPLRQRREDILPLVDEMCGTLNKKYHQKKRFTHAALLALKSYSWPGNLRELRNVVERAMILCNDDVIDLGDLPIQEGVQLSEQEVEEFAGPLDLRRLVAEMELRYIHSAYQKYGNVRDAARSLGLDPSTYVRKRSKLEQLQTDE